MGAGITPAPSKQKIKYLTFTASHISGEGAREIECWFPCAPVRN